MTDENARRMRRVCAECMAFCGTPIPDEGDLSDYVAHLAGRLAPKTVKNRRAYVLTVMRFAATVGGLERLNHDLVRRVKVPPPSPVAWQKDEYKALKSAALKLQGNCYKRPDLPRAVYAIALVPAAYETGLRKGDLFEIHRDEFRPDGSIRLRQHKTSVGHTCGVRPATLKKILAIPYEFPLRWDGNPRTYSELWRDMRKIAGLKGGATQQLRRTAATDVWVDRPELVKQFLGHLSENMWRCYVDTERDRKPILPPE